jgi:hypothetical protein
VPHGQGVADPARAGVQHQPNLLALSAGQLEEVVARSKGAELHGRLGPQRLVALDAVGQGVLRGEALQSASSSTCQYPRPAGIRRSHADSTPVRSSG